MRDAILTTIAAAAASLLLVFIVAPMIGLVGAGGLEGVRLIVADAEVRSALVLTAACATVATFAGMVGGTPVAYFLERREFRGKPLVAALIDLPLVIPHPVAGIALLLVLGRESAAGSVLGTLGFRLVGTPTGIVCAMLFVSIPLYIAAAREAIGRVDPRYEGVARTLGDGPWRALRRVTLPLAGRGLIAAALVMWARAISEFGAIVVLTYNPKVASVLTYDRFTSYGLRDALPVAAVLVLLAIVPLAALRALRRAG